MLPQFRQLELELDWAIDSEERRAAARTLSSYAYLANEVAALAEELQLSELGVINDIRAAGHAASKAKNDLYAQRSKKVATIVSGVQAHMATVTDHVSMFRNSQQLRASATGGVHGAQA